MTARGELCHTWLPVLLHLFYIDSARLLCVTSVHFPFHLTCFLFPHLSSLSSFIRFSPRFEFHFHHSKATEWLPQHQNPNLETPRFTQAIAIAVLFNTPPRLLVQLNRAPRKLCPATAPSAPRTAICWYKSNQKTLSSLKEIPKTAPSTRSVL